MNSASKRKYEKTDKNENDSNSGKRAKNESEIIKIPVINDTREAIDYLITTTTMTISLPPIVFVHQVYALVKKRTKVDLDIEQLRKANIIKLFNYNENANNSMCLCYTSQLTPFLDSMYPIRPEHLKVYLNTYLLQPTDSCISKSDLTSVYSVCDSTITYLIQNCFLTIKDSHAYFHTIPNLGQLFNFVSNARGSIRFVISKKKYKEMNIYELKHRNLKKLKQLGLMYHLFDVIGNDMVKLVDSPMGIVLKLNND